MTPTTIRFLKAGMAYFVLGSLLGLLLAFPPTQAALYRLSSARWSLVHTHLNLAGFVVLVIFGVAYHILPRFRGKPLHSEAWAAAHFWIATLSTAGMALGFAFAAAASLLWIASAGSRSSTTSRWTPAAAAARRSRRRPPRMAWTWTACCGP